MTTRAKAESLLVVTALVWGTTFVIVKAALADASPLAFIAPRFTLAGLLLFPLLWRGPYQRRVLVPGLALGLFLFAGYLLQTSGLLYTTPSKSAFITGSSVILVPLFMFLGGARLRRGAAVGALAGLAGLYILVAPSGMQEVNRGDVLTLIAAAAFAMHILLVDSYTRRVPFRQLVPVQILTVGLAASCALPWDRPVRFHWTAGLGLALAVTALLATAFAFTVQNWAQQYTPPTHTVLIFALEPVFAALASRFFMGERLGGRVLVGAALVLAGMLISERWGGTAPAAIES